MWDTFWTGVRVPSPPPKKRMILSVTGKDFFMQLFDIIQAVQVNTRNGGVVIWGGIRDEEQISRIPNLQILHREWFRTDEKAVPYQHLGWKEDYERTSRYWVEDPEYRQPQLI